MIVAPLLLIVVAFVTALRWHPASGYLDTQSMATVSDFVCRTDARRYSVAAHYGIWRSVRIRGASPTFDGECVVNVSLATYSERQPSGRPQLLLLMKIEQLWLREVRDNFYVVHETTPQYFKRLTPDFCIVALCGPTYLWASESVTLYLYYYGDMSVSNVSYGASFVVTEATNVCRLANFSGELVVRSDGSSEYAFASNARHKDLPHNDVKCIRDLEYSLTVRSSVASDVFTVTVLACPSSGGCGTLRLNGQSCTDDVRLVSAPPGSNVTLRYVLGSRNCDDVKYAGFVVSARIVASTETTSTLLVVAVSVAAALAAALVIGITIALLRRRRHRRQRSLGRKSPSSAVRYAQSSASADDEEIAMVGNDLYGVALASRTTIDQ